MSMNDQGFDTKPKGLSKYTLDFRAQSAYLLNEWKLMFRPSTLMADIMAGIAVALVALPLSLAIANASGVPPEVGLITAIIGGIVVALLGGCRLQVSGPAAAMTFLVYEIIVKYGIEGLILATFLAGIFQVLTGVFRVGRLMQFVPRPVVAGFLTGIGITILSQQSSVILGYGHLLERDEEGGAVAVLIETVRHLDQTVITSLIVGVTAMALMFLVPRISRKLPTPLIAVVGATLLPMVFGWTEVRLLGALPTEIPRPTLPAVPWDIWNEIVMAAVTIYVLASIESLLCAAVVDSMQKETQVDHDQELFGQGLGNVSSALFGGIPVTGVIARSATNVQAGGRTRFSAIFHALLILAMMFLMAPLVARIPLAALAGVLSAVAFRMVEIHMLRALWRGSRPEALVFMVTAGVMLMTDLIVGVQVGMVAAFLYVVYEMSRLDVQEIHLPQPPHDEPNGAIERCPAVHLIRVDGPLFFASGFHLRSLVNRLTGYRCLMIDMEEVPFLDVTGAEILEEAIEALNAKGTKVILVRPSQTMQNRLRTLADEHFHSLHECPIFGDPHEAAHHALSLVDKEHLCSRCKPQGQCEGLVRTAQEEVGTMR